MIDRPKYYVLDESNEAVATDLLSWAAWFENTEHRRVGYDEVDGHTISTVFLGLDHNFSDHGEPIIFETLVRDERGDEVAMLRYSTYDAAKKSHDRIVEQAKNGEEIWHD